MAFPDPHPDAPTTLAQAPGAAVEALLTHLRPLLFLGLPFAFIVTTLTFFADEFLQNPQLLFTAPSSPSSLLFIGLQLAILATYAFFWAAGLWTLHPSSPSDDAPSDPLEAAFDHFLPTFGLIVLVGLIACSGVVLILLLRMLGLYSALSGVLALLLNAGAATIAIASLVFLAPAIVPVALGHTSIIDGLTLTATATVKCIHLTLGMLLFAILPYIIFLALSVIAFNAFDLSLLDDYQYLLSGFLAALLWPYLIVVFHTLYMAQLHHLPD